jgi:signal transduction histidine kinase
MRRRLALLVLSVTAMVSVAYLLPLAVVVQVVARDRALSAADQESRTLAGVLASIPDPAGVASVVAQIDADSPRSVAVFLDDGTRIGAPVALDANELEVARSGRAFTAASGDGRRIIAPVRNADGTVTVAVVFVPDELLREGVMLAWVVIGGVGVVLVLLGVALADRLARSMIVASDDLRAVTERLQRGELDARVVPSGPAEIAAVGRTINELADQIDDLLVAEREAVADLSHRLRTPLAALQLEADAVQPEEKRQWLQERVDRVTAELNAVIAELRRPRRAPSAAATDLGRIASERLEFWAVLAEDQDRDWTFRGPERTALVALDSEEVAAAIDSLLGNVLAHTPEGTAFGVDVIAGATEHVVVVIDDGPGLPEGADERGASGGGSTGLGLDIVRRTAERGGGSLHITRSARGGARIEVHFAAVHERLRR